MWLVAKTDVKKENWAATNIEQQGYEYYLPKFKSVLRRRTEILFPGYIFCKTASSWRFLTGTRGVSYVLSFGDKPGTISDDFIQALKQRENAEGFVVLPQEDERSRFVQGQSVRLRSGPFSGYIGLYDGQLASQRERVLLELMGRTVAVQVSGDDLEEI